MGKRKRISGADLGFQVRGWVLKKIAPSGGRRENFWGISCEKSRFYAKKHIFFPILGGRAPGAPPPPLDPPLDIRTGTDNDILNTVQKTKERATRTH